MLLAGLDEFIDEVLVDVALHEDRVRLRNTWPSCRNTPIIALGTAISISASGKMMFGDLPPSSSDTRLRFPAEACRISLPTSVEPVKATLSMSRMFGDRASGAGAEAGDDIDDAVGQTGFQDQLAEPSAVSGVCSAGFRITVLPHASAGASFQAAISSGKFHGMIWPQTPMGSRRV